MTTGQSATVKRGWAWFGLGALPVAAIAIFAIATGLGVAQEGDDSAQVEREAVAALGQRVGDCSGIADPMYREVTPAEIDAQADSQGITTSGWVNSRFIGSAEELAASRDAKLVASGKNTAWTLELDSSGRKSISEFVRVDLPSGRIAWQPGRTIAIAPCP